MEIGEMNLRKKEECWRTENCRARGEECDRQNARTTQMQEMNRPCFI